MTEQFDLAQRTAPTTPVDTSWQPEVDALEQRRAQVRAMGGPEAVQRQHDRGRSTVREHIDKLLDPGSFREVGSLTGDRTDNGFVPANNVVGRGEIDGRTVVLTGNDFTIRGGSSDKSVTAKIEHPESFAHDYRLPLIRLIESGGGSLHGLESLGRTYVPEVPGWATMVSNLATIPVVSLAMGPCGGIAAARVAASHYSVMVEKNAQLFAGGPPLVAAAGEIVDKEALGGSAIHTRNGMVTDAASSESEAFAKARRFLSYLPNSVFELPARGELTDDPSRRDDWLISAIPKNRRKIYKIRPIVESLVDHGSFFEMGKNWGPSIVVGFARLDGWPVAVLTEDARYGGALTADGAEKMEWIVDLAETFHLPVVHLVDQSGIPIGTVAEKAATLRHAVRAASAVHQATVPWCSILMRRVFGVGGAIHTNTSRAQFRYAWPSGDWGSLPTEGGIEATFKSLIESSDDPGKTRALIAEQMEKFRDPLLTAEAFGVEDIIDPRDTRTLLCEFARLAAPLRRTGPSSWGYRG